MEHLETHFIWGAILVDTLVFLAVYTHHILIELDRVKSEKEQLTTALTMNLWYLYNTPMAAQGLPKIPPGDVQGHLQYYWGMTQNILQRPTPTTQLNPLPVLRRSL